MMRILLLLLVLSSCTRTYHVDGHLNARFDRYVSSRHPGAGYVRYDMNLRPHVFYRNRVSEKVMLSDHSRIKLMNIHIIPEAGNHKRQWLKFYLSGSSEHPPRVGSNVYFFSVKGLTDTTGSGNPERFELIKFYKGTLSYYDPDSSFSVQITSKGEAYNLKTLDRLLKADLECERADLEGKHCANFETFLSFRDDTLQVHSLIDYGHGTRDNLKATIYDFVEVYGEVLWFAPANHLP